MAGDDRGLQLVGPGTLPSGGTSQYPRGIRDRGTIPQ
jgi:hypothetical protein